MVRNQPLGIKHLMSVGKCGPNFFFSKPRVILRAFTKHNSLYCISNGIYSNGAISDGVSRIFIVHQWVFYDILTADRVQYADNALILPTRFFSNDIKFKFTRIHIHAEIINTSGVAVRFILMAEE